MLKGAAFAISSGVPILPTGIAPTIFSFTLSGIVLVISVSINPGQITLQVIPKLPTSFVAVLLILQLQLSLQDNLPVQYSLSTYRRNINNSSISLLSHIKKCWLHTIKHQLNSLVILVPKQISPFYVTLRLL